MTGALGVQPPPVRVTTPPGSLATLSLTMPKPGGSTEVVGPGLGGGVDTAGGGSTIGGGMVVVGAVACGVVGVGRTVGAGPGPIRRI